MRHLERRVFQQPLSLGIVDFSSIKNFLIPFKIFIDQILNQLFIGITIPQPRKKKTQSPNQIQLLWLKKTITALFVLKNSPKTTKLPFCNAVIDSKLSVSLIGEILARTHHVPCVEPSNLTPKNIRRWDLSSHETIS